MKKTAFLLGVVLASVCFLPTASEAARGHDKKVVVAKSAKKAVRPSSKIKAKSRSVRASPVATKTPRMMPKKRQGALMYQSEGGGSGLLPSLAKTSVVSNPVVGEAVANLTLGAATLSKKGLPQRMYAFEGDSFYLNGRKYRVDGVSPPLAKQEITKQRLQQLLDSGEVSIEPKGMDEAGVTTAVIRVAGRDVAETLR
jgi:hypothetical protein